MGRRVGIVCVLAALVLVSVAAGAPASHADGVRYRDEVFAATALLRQDVAYGEAVGWQGTVETLLLDVHEGAGDAEANRAAVIWVHGGYFKRGSKDDSYDKAEMHKLTKAGYVVAAINYRLDPRLPEGAGPAITEARVIEYANATTNAQYDAQAAVRWVRAHAAELRVDPSKIAIAGHSAGGITATRVASNDHDPGTSGTPGVSSSVAAAVSFAGGALPGYMTQIEPGEPPQLFIHGVVDDVVPYPAAALPCAAALAMLNTCEQVLDPDQDHSIFGGEYAADFLYRHMIQPPALPLPIGLTLA